MKMKAEQAIQQAIERTQHALHQSYATSTSSRREEFMRGRIDGLKEALKYVRTRETMEEVGEE